MCFNSFNKSLYKDKMLRKQYIIQKGMSALKQQKWTLANDQPDAQTFLIHLLKSSACLEQ
jgi:hypothetical protein